MILTGKAIEAAEEFEENFGHLETFELSEGDQISLYKITVMFNRDKAFMHYISACTEFFSDSVLELRKDKIAKVLFEMMVLTKEE